ncbi:MAG TPA: histidine kinase [Rubrobacter sp.]|nr:histidine kinase [Rubrobacter sp.]
MENTERSFEEHPEAARILEERFWEIFEDYKCRLREMKSLLIVGDGTTPEQLENNARSVLGRAAKVLGGEERSLLAVEEEIYRNIDSAVEPLNPHPDESFRAGVALCKATVTVVVKNLVPGMPPEKIAEIALVVQEIVMDRVSRMVMASYVDYLLTKVKETQFEERRRYSRELHDRLAHQMTVVTQSLDLYRTFRESDAERAERRLTLAPESARESLDLMHEFANRCRRWPAGGPHARRRGRSRGRLDDPARLQFRGGSAALLAPLRLLGWVARQQERNCGPRLGPLRRLPRRPARRPRPDPRDRPLWAARPRQPVAGGIRRAARHRTMMLRTGLPRRLRWVTPIPAGRTEPKPNGRQ